jgi:hypothetical protein
VPSPRESRSLVPFEALAVLVIAVVPLPDPVPAALPLLVAGTLSRWIRGRSWADVVSGGFSTTGERLAPDAWRGLSRFGIGALAGALALGFAVLAGTPAIENLGRRAIEWSSYPIVRGNFSIFAMVAAYVAATAIATELALRGWLVERVLELSPGPPVMPILVGAVAEALVTPGDLAARLGAALFGIGLGWMYIAGGRSVLAPIAARLVFQLGVLFLEALRLIG